MLSNLAITPQLVSIIAAVGWSACVYGVYHIMTPKSVPCEEFTLKGRNKTTMRVRYKHNMLSVFVNNSLHHVTDKGIVCIQMLHKYGITHIPQKMKDIIAKHLKQPGLPEWTTGSLCVPGAYISISEHPLEHKPEHNQGLKVDRLFTINYNNRCIFSKKELKAYCHGRGIIIPCDLS